MKNLQHFRLFMIKQIKTKIGQKTKKTYGLKRERAMRYSKQKSMKKMILEKS